MSKSQVHWIHWWGKFFQLPDLGRCDVYKWNYLAGVVAAVVVVDNVGVDAVQDGILDLVYWLI